MIPQADRSPLVRVQQAVAALQTRDRDGAAALVAGLVAENPALGSTWGPLSRLALALGETTLALKAADNLATLNRNDLSARLGHGALLAQHGKGTAARDAGLAMVADHPQQPAAWHFLASCRATLGEAPGAIADFRRAIACSADPRGAAPSWLALTGLRTFRREDDEDLLAITRLLDLWPATAPPSEARASLLYALGKARDDLGDSGAAFPAYAEGAAIVARSRSDDPDAGDAFVDDVIGGLSREVLERLPRGVDSQRPIFVLGLPRSGTTLVEQILVSHSGVVDGGELNLFRAAAIPVGGFSPAAITAFAAVRPEGYAAVGEAYLHMLLDRFGPEGRVVDKTLNHSRFVGLIHCVLPQARFIWLRRDPGAVAWSSFRTWFAQGVSWSWSLERIARYFRAEDRLHAHWTAVMGEAILTVPYEALISQPGPWIDRILDHVGLPHEAGLESFHKTGRTVTTASYAQVRQPLYTTSTDAWRRYEAQLMPFFAAYQGASM